MSHSVIQSIICDIDSSFFSLIADEYTDISNKEQLTVCIRWIDTNFNIHEDLLGFYNIPDIKSITIASAIKDALIRVQLSLNKCRGQCYDGAKNMMGHISGVAKLIKVEQPNALVTHCHAHSLSLSVKSTTEQCKILSDVMNTSKEIVNLIKYSPKRENILGDIKKNLQEEVSTGGILKLSATRWTIRAVCFKRILDNYEALMLTWEQCLDERSVDAEVRGRIIGCQSQMATFHFYFGIHLGHRLFSQTDNLSKNLQTTKISSLDGQRLTRLVKEVFNGMRTDESFRIFYEGVQDKARLLQFVGEPTLPRQRRAPTRFDIGSGSGSFPESPSDMYRQLYFEALDLITTSIDRYFDQESFKVYTTFESLLLKTLKSESIDNELQFIETKYSTDIDIEKLRTQLQVLPFILSDISKIECFSDIVTRIHKLPFAERELICEVLLVCRLMLVNPATSATGEKTFSMARRLKTWLRSNMTQERFNSLAILHWHKERTAGINIEKIADRFINCNENRMRHFGCKKSGE
jgi:hypothetical protein